MFLVADREQVSTREFIERLARAAETSPRLFWLPPPLFEDWRSRSAAAGGL